MLDGNNAGRPDGRVVHELRLAKRLSKRGKHFGTGEPEGIVAPETADHAAGTSAMLPMLALGIPGSATPR
jgi:TctA family transporter